MSRAGLRAERGAGGALVPGGVLQDARGGRAGAAGAAERPVGVVPRRCWRRGVCARRVCAPRVPAVAGPRGGRPGAVLQISVPALIALFYRCGVDFKCPYSNRPLKPLNAVNRRVAGVV